MRWLVLTAVVSLFLWFSSNSFAQNNSQEDEEPVRIPIVVDISCDQADPDCANLTKLPPIMFRGHYGSPQRILIDGLGLRETHRGSGKWVAMLYPGDYQVDPGNYGHYSLKKVTIGSQDITPLSILPHPDEPLRNEPYFTVAKNMKVEPITLHFQAEGSIAGETTEKGKPARAMIILDDKPYTSSGQVDRFDPKSKWAYQVNGLAEGSYRLCAMKMENYEVINRIYPSPLEGWCKAKPVKLKAGEKITLNLQSQHFSTAAIVSTEDEIKAAQSAASIEKFAKAGHRFTTRSLNRTTAAIEAVRAGPKAFQAFLKAGGTFKGKPGNSEITDRSASDIAILVAYNAKEIPIYAAAGGKFPDEPFQIYDLTPAMYALHSRETIEAYAKAGGKFVNHEDVLGRDLGIQAAQYGPEIIDAFSKAGGKFTDHQDVNGRTAEDWAKSMGEKNLAAYNNAVKQQGGLVYERRAQIGKTSIEEAPTCSRHDLDTTFNLASNAEKREQTLTVNYINISKYPCALRYSNRFIMGWTYKDVCCRVGGFSGPGGIPKPFMLNPGKAAHMTYRWSNDANELGYSASDPDRMCLNVNALWGYALTVMNSDILPTGRMIYAERALTPYIDISFIPRRMLVCSEAAHTDYVDGIEPAAPDPHKATRLNIQLSQDVPTHYSGNRITLHLGITDPDRVLPVKPDEKSPELACGKLSLLQKTRYEDGGIYYEEIGQEMKCKVFDSYVSSRHIEVTYNKLNIGMPHETKETVGKGDQSVTVGYLYKNADGLDIQATSNPITLHFEDPDSIPPAWGKGADGFFVSLKLDTNNFKTSSDILAHVACSRLTEDWRASFPLEDSSPCNPDIEIRISDGKPVTVVEKNVAEGLASHSCTKETYEFSDEQNVAKAFVFKKEISLNRSCVGGAAKGYFVNKPGTYTVTAVWRPLSKNPPLKTEVLSQPVTFHITGE